MRSGREKRQVEFRIGREVGLGYWRIGGGGRAIFFSSVLWPRNDLCKVLCKIHLFLTMQYHSKKLHCSLAWPWNGLYILGCLRHDPLKKMCTTSEVYIHPGGMPQVWA